MNLWGVAGKECSQVTYTLGKETINFVLSYDLCQVDTGGLKLQMDTVAMKNYGVLWGTSFTIELKAITTRKKSKQSTGIPMYMLKKNYSACKALVKSKL